MKPLLKWAGGKTKLLPILKANLPEKFDNYHEPFFGGGALFFDLELNRKERLVRLSDSNFELVNFYTVLQFMPIDLWQSLQTHQNTTEYYYKIRDLDRNPEEFIELHPVTRASRFFFLNKTCFNGLYRVNSKGQFNAPYGKRKTISFPTQEEIMEYSGFLLRNSAVTCRSFEESMNFIYPGDMVYLDPPYAPISKTSSFTSYTQEGFGMEMQERLVAFCHSLTKRGAKFLLSNSYTPLTLDLYKDFDIRVIEAPRAIAANGNRDRVKEVLVRNY